jgi:hypothetical protein
MADFEISDDLSVDLAPAIIAPIGTPDLKQNLTCGNQNSFGLQLNLTF